MYTVLPLVHVSGTKYYFESDQFSTYYIAYSEKENDINPSDEVAHKHEYTEWSVLQSASWTYKGYAERYCECGEKESKIIEESWTEWLCRGALKTLKKFF